MAVSAGTVVELFRARVGDTVSPYLWSDDELWSFLDQAQNEFAIATNCFRDASTFVPTVTIADEWVDVDSRITKIVRARLVTAARDLGIRHYADMSSVVFEDYGVRSVSGTWETTTGTPLVAINDLETDKLRLYPIPIAADTLALTVYRLPLKVVDGDSVTLEVPQQYHIGLMLKMEALAFIKQDADTFDPNRSATAEIQFQNFLYSAKVDYSRKRGPGVVKSYVY